MEEQNNDPGSTEDGERGGGSSQTRENKSPKQQGSGSSGQSGAQSESRS